MPCTPNAKECVNDNLARVCPADGSGWLAQPCHAGEKCAGGECKADPMAPCTSDQNTCMDAMTALRCNMTGNGFDVVTCPAKTTCSGAGVCQGACAVGSSFCLDTHTVSTCMDGVVYQTAACTDSSLCVKTGDTPYVTAACKPSECTPGKSGCDLVCGNMVDSTADQTKFLSRCTSTPDGYRWSALACPAPTSCSPSGQSCTSGSGSQASCASECKPGQQRCAGNSTSSGYQVCGADGKWPVATTLCNPDASVTPLLQCMVTTTDSNKVVCADAVCAGGFQGTCDTGGQFHACGADGKIAANGAACASGSCASVGSPPVPNAPQPGACLPVCKSGDERCVGVQYQTCSSGVWGASQSCSAGSCQPFTNGDGRPARVCGVCVPGTHRCTDVNGMPGTAYVQTCDSTGQWTTPAVCSVGACGTTGTDFGCIAQCVPNKKFCSGVAKTGAGMTIAGTASESLCPATGLTTGVVPTACTGEATCRKDEGGNPLGCTLCVGTKNEFGLQDTRCSDAAGANPGTAAVQSCAADGMSWVTPPTTICPAMTTCKGASNNIPIPTVLGPYCHTINLGAGPVPSTDSNIKAAGFSGCSALGGGPANAPMSCPLANGGSVGDCCGPNWCRADSSATPTPALCSP
jgi:hypothetical protein